MADAEPDGGEDPTVPVLPRAGDPQPVVDPDTGLARHPSDLGRGDHRARAADRRHVGRDADARRRTRGRWPAPLPLPDGQAGRALPDRAGGRRSEVPGDRPAHWRVGRTRHAQASRRRVRRPAQDGRHGGSAVRPLSLGPLRPARPAARLSVRRHGEPAPHLCHAHCARGRPVVDLLGGARAGAQLVGQPGHQRDLGRFLAERGLHRLFREPHHGGALRQGPRRHAGRPRLVRPAIGAEGQRRPRHRAAPGPDRPRPRRRADRHRV